MGSILKEQMDIRYRTAIFNDLKDIIEKYQTNTMKPFYHKFRRAIEQSEQNMTFIEEFKTDFLTLIYLHHTQTRCFDLKTHVKINPSFKEHFTKLKYIDYESLALDNPTLDVI